MESNCQLEEMTESYQLEEEDDIIYSDPDDGDDDTDFIIPEEEDAHESLSDGEIVFSESEEGSVEKTQTPEDKITWKEQVNMMYDRKVLNELKDNICLKEEELSKLREEVKRSDEHAMKLDEEMRELKLQIAQADSIPTAQRLYAKQGRICKELKNEDRIKTELYGKIDVAIYVVAEAHVIDGQYMDAARELNKREDRLHTQQAEVAHVRQTKDVLMKNAADKRKIANERTRQKAQKEREKKDERALEEVKKSQEKANKYLQKTINKIRNRVATEEQEEKNHRESRMKVMLGLKNSIKDNRENIQSIQARAQAIAKQQKDEEEKAREVYLSVGQNASEQMRRNKQVELLHQQYKDFNEHQREEELRIAERLIAEDENYARRKKLQPYLWDKQWTSNEKVVKPHRKKKLKILEDLIKVSSTSLDELAVEANPAPVSPYHDEARFHEDSEDGDEEGGEMEEGEGGEMAADMAAKCMVVSDSEEDEVKENLAKPEFDGLWDKHQDYRAPAQLDSKWPTTSKMQKDILQRGFEKQKASIVTKQIAGGKPFSGQAFYSKPDVIHFKNFTVGKTYKKRVILTNVSYGINSCKLVGISQHLKDFIETQFDPPGQMSAGLTCELLVTFTPKIHEDLEGVVNFLAQTGPFSIPIKCTTKKCDLTVGNASVDFGTAVIGEVLRRTIVLRNNGALGTTVDFFKITGAKLNIVSPEESSVDGGRSTAEECEENLSSVSEKETFTDMGPSNEDSMLESFEEQPSQQVSDVSMENEQKVETVPDLDVPKTVAAESIAMTTSVADEQPVAPPTGASCVSPASRDLDGLAVIGAHSLQIEPRSSLKLEVEWKPTIPGHVQADFLISFGDPNSENIPIGVTANAIGVPVWLQHQSIDMNICTLDRLFQDTVIVNNRATTALRLKFEVCAELRGHLELLPKTGYIQAQSQFSAQLKFLPRKSLFQDAKEYYDPDTGVLEVPLKITVADQARPVPFTMSAIITSSDLEFDTKVIDFGFCTIYESVKRTITITNKSLLSQQYGFIRTPDYVDVQPGDGFGTILPLETISMDIILSPEKAMEYEFELMCKTLINREFKLKCIGVGVHPPLTLSDQVIKFAATALNDIAIAKLRVVNEHLSKNEFSHPVPRIGRGEIAEVQPTSFEFVVPDDVPLTVSPCVGTVQPGQDQVIQVTFKPTLQDADIRRQAVTMIHRQMEIQAEEAYKAALKRQKEAAEVAATKRKPSARGKKTSAIPTGDVDALAGPATVQPPSEDSIIAGSADYLAAQSSLIRDFCSSHATYQIPCYVASGSCSASQLTNCQYSVHNTLYLEVHCPCVRPQIVVISDDGRTTIDFDRVSVGQTVKKAVTIQNVTDGNISLVGSVLDTTGPYMILNSMRDLAAGRSHVIQIRFTPHDQQVFQEVLTLHCPLSCLFMTLRGIGVTPEVKLSIENKLMDMGAVIMGEYREETFKIINMSPLAVEYKISMDSGSLLRQNTQTDIPEFIKPNRKLVNWVGTQNNNGRCVFDCVPTEGVIPADDFKEITVTFAPDHASDNYSDGVHLELFGQEKMHTFRLIGEAKPHIMYLTGGDRLTPQVESLSYVPMEQIFEDVKPAPIPLLVTMSCEITDKGVMQASGEIQVGCVRTMAVSQKKNGEWSFDNMQQIASLGFNIDPLKGMVEAATKKSVKITWTPAPGQDPGQVVEASILCTVKGDVVEQYKVILRALITLT